MRKILTTEELQRGERKRARVVTILMLVILVSSTLGYAFFSNPSVDSEQQKEATESGLQYTGSRWQFTLGDQVLSFATSPEASANLSFNMSMTLEDYAGKNLYLVSDNDGIAQELASNLGRYTSRVQAACYGSCEKNLPEKNCSENLLIVNASSQQMRVYQQQQCIFIDGDMRAVDGFLYAIFGVR